MLGRRLSGARRPSTVNVYPTCIPPSAWPMFYGKRPYSGGSAKRPGELLHVDSKIQQTPGEGRQRRLGRWTQLSVEGRSKTPRDAGAAEVGSWDNRSYRNSAHLWWPSLALGTQVCADNKKPRSSGLSSRWQQHRDLSARHASNFRLRCMTSVRDVTPLSGSKGNVMLLTAPANCCAMPRRWRAPRSDPLNAIGHPHGRSSRSLWQPPEAGPRWA